MLESDKTEDLIFMGELLQKRDFFWKLVMEDETNFNFLWSYASEDRKRELYCPIDDPPSWLEECFMKKLLST